MDPQELELLCRAGKRKTSWRPTALQMHCKDAKQLGILLLCKCSHMAAARGIRSSFAFGIRTGHPPSATFHPKLPLGSAFRVRVGVQIVYEVWHCHFGVLHQAG